MYFWKFLCRFSCISVLKDLQITWSHVTSRVPYNRCLGEVTIFHYNLAIFTKLQRLYNLVQDFWEFRALAARSVCPPMPELVNLIIIATRIPSLNSLSRSDHQVWRLAGNWVAYGFESGFGVGNFLCPIVFICCSRMPSSA